MRKNIFFFLLSTPFLIGELPPLQENQVSSTHASYDGNALILQGRVQLDHGLGNMSADQAFLEKQEAGKDFPFSFISLKKEVLLSLKNHAELKCDSAELDFNALKGSLISVGQERVSYIDQLKKSEKTPTSFQILSRAIDLQFAKKNSSSEQTQYEVHSLLAKEDVCINYAKDFALQADEASYYSAGSQDKSLHGTIHAYPTQDSHRCRISYLGEPIEADAIDIDIDQSEIQVKKPKGSLPFEFFAQDPSGKIFFECGNLTWNHTKEVLFLSNRVTLKETNLGSLYAEEGITIEQGSSQNKKFIKTAHINGLSRLEYENTPSGWKHVISCFGSLHIDGIKGQITMTSPQEKEKQVHYSDEQMILLSDKAFIEYSEQTYQPVSLTLKGNVVIKSSNPEEPLRCGLADRLTYSPDTQTVILSALPKKRVLFSDEEQKVSMSAQEVHLTKDLLTGKTQIKGVGNVKFFLSSEENSLLKTWIPAYTQETLDEIR